MLIRCMEANLLKLELLGLRAVWCEGEELGEALGLDNVEECVRCRRGV